MHEAVSHGSLLHLHYHKLIWHPGSGCYRWTWLVQLCSRDLQTLCFHIGWRISSAYFVQRWGWIILDCSLAFRNINLRPGLCNLWQIFVSLYISILKDINLLSKPLICWLYKAPFTLLSANNQSLCPYSLLRVEITIKNKYVRRFNMNNKRIAEC